MIFMDGERHWEIQDLLVSDYYALLSMLPSEEFRMHEIEQAVLSMLPVEIKEEFELDMAEFWHSISKARRHLLNIISSLEKA